MNFSEMQYSRPDVEALKAKIGALTQRFAAAKSYEEAREVFLELDAEKRHFVTASELAGIRHMIDTRDEFYDRENEFMNNSWPEVQEPQQLFISRMRRIGNDTPYPAINGYCSFRISSNTARHCPSV